jgi:hypothetical protein
VDREYDLFERLADGAPTWRGGALGLVEVRQKLLRLSKLTQNECFAIHLPTKEIVARVNVQTIDGKKPAVFQITYDPSVGDRRAEILRLHGYEVLTVIGNEAAKVVLTIPQEFDLFVIGDGTDHDARREMVSWLKANFPHIRILAVNSSPTEELAGADYNAKVDGPEKLLPLIAAALGGRSGSQSISS